jgi:hypothetical protein
MTAGWVQKPEMEAGAGDDVAEAMDDGFMVFSFRHDQELGGGGGGGGGGARGAGGGGGRAPPPPAAPPPPQRLVRDRCAVSHDITPPS